MKINHRHFALIILALSSVFVSAYVYALVYKKVLAQAGHYAALSEEVSSAGSRKNHEKELALLHESSKADRAKIASFTLREENVVNFIETVEKVGDDTGTKFELSSIDKEPESIKAKITASGSWTAIMKTLLLIENLPFNVSVTNVYLTTSSGFDKSASKAGDGGSAGANSWNLSLDIEAATIK